MTSIYNEGKLITSFGVQCGLSIYRMVEVIPASLARDGEETLLRKDTFVMCGKHKMNKLYLHYKILLDL